MRVFCYARKSAFSEKSSSVQNQIDMCKKYIYSKYQDQIEIFEAYTDEDFSGSNTNRPGLQTMMEKVYNGECDLVVVYQLDRLSRSIRDFANLYANFEDLGVHFLSIVENIDTSSPVGKAMMYMSAIFAEMERQNISQRVTDHMNEMAGRGYWMAGEAPAGYYRKRVVENGREHVVLDIDEDGVEFVRGVLSDFLNNTYSLSGMQTAYKRAGKRTRRGYFFSSAQLYLTLTMPFCVEATPEVYDFFEAKGCKMISPRELWDGSHGVMVYGRTTEKKNRHELNPPSQWRVSVGKHPFFVKAEEWLAVQKKLSNGKKFRRNRKYPVRLLKGVLRCAKCGNLMQVASKKRNAKGDLLFSYYCRKRMLYGASACDMSMIKADPLDQKALDVFKSIKADPKLILKYCRTKDKSNPEDIKSLNGKITSTERKIDKLTSALASAEGSSAVKYIISEIEKLDANLTDLKKALSTASAYSKK